MRSTRHAGAIALASLLLVACGDQDAPTAATPGSPLLAAVEAGGKVQGVVNMLDACDPATFNAVLGPGTCVGSGTVTFEAFIAELAKRHKVSTWRFDPRQTTIRVGQTLTAPNLGGEAHTFTEVEEFGGGIVPELNDLAKTPVVAPECMALTGADFIAPGQAFSEVEDETGVERYQCCLHPWMRAVVVVRK